MVVCWIEPTNQRNRSNEAKKEKKDTASQRWRQQLLSSLALIVTHHNLCLSSDSSAEIRYLGPLISKFAVLCKFGDLKEILGD